MSATGGGTAITLPAEYVARHVDLAYATTAHRAQGDTVDTAHAVVRPQMSREVLYVAMTRGRDANTAYVCTNADDDEYGPANSGQPARCWRRCSPAPAPNCPPTRRCAPNRNAPARSLNSRPNTTPSPDEAHRQRWAALTEAARRRHPLAGRAPVASSHRTQTMIAGLIPAATQVIDPDLQQALTERAALIEQRAEALVSRAIATHQPWIARLGPPPNDPARRLLWERAASTVAAYRDRHGVTDPANPVGEAHGGGQWTRRADRRRAIAAIADARRAGANPSR